MRLEIIDTIDRGIPGKERLYLKVITSTNLIDYIIFQTKIDAHATIIVSSNSGFWLPKYKVNAGDILILYTGNGDNSTRKNADGTTTHFIYWGLNETIFNSKNSAATVFELRNWTTSKALE